MASSSKDNKSTMRVASIDIGAVNFALCVEDVKLEPIQDLKEDILSLKERYEKDGIPTRKFAKILNKIYKIGTVVALGVFDLTEGGKYDLLDPHTLQNMNKILMEHLPVLDECDIVLIEEQMKWGMRSRNTSALKLFQHCRSFFIFHYGPEKLTVEFPAYFKTQILGMPRKWFQRKMTKHYRKKWAEIMAKEIMRMRGDDESLAKLENRERKSDDIADAICQLQAFKIVSLIDEMKLKYV